MRLSVCLFWRLQSCISRCRSLLSKKETLRSSETAVESDKVIEPRVEDALPVNQVIEMAPEQVEVKKIAASIIPEIVKSASRTQEEIVSVKTPYKKRSSAMENRHVNRGLNVCAAPSFY